MDKDSEDALLESLKGYKKELRPVINATLMWEGDFIFTGKTEQGYEMRYDARSQRGYKPMDTLLLSLVSCIGIDVIMILQKMRVKVVDFKADISGERDLIPPQCYKAIVITLHLAGKDLDPKKVERAVSLSKKKYCAVYHTLKKDLEVNVKYFLEEKEPVDIIND
ncbi:OsmC family protein [Thermodesulfovibrionales bacterium]|nr:OsmC family protein [Thermodesulfovibrionales bacterium]